MSKDELDTSYGLKDMALSTLGPVGSGFSVIRWKSFFYQSDEFEEIFSNMRLHFSRDYFTLEETSAKWKNGIKISKCRAQKLSVKFFPDFWFKMYFKPF